MYLYSFYSYTVRFTEKTGEIVRFTRSKFSALLLFSFRPRVKSASRDQVCQTRVRQPIKTLTLAMGLLLRQAIVTVTESKHPKNGEMFCSIEGLFSPNIYSCLSRRKQVSSTRLVYKKHVRKRWRKLLNLEYSLRQQPNIAAAER